MKRSNLGSVRLEDIAKHLKVSIATVSRALNNDERVRFKTKKTIQDKAKELGYRPNIFAKSLSSGKTQNIGVIIPRYDEAFFIEVCRGIDYFARKHNYKIQISSSRNSFSHEQELLNTFNSGMVDGVILSFSHTTNSYHHIHNLIKRNIPIVLFDNILTLIEGAGHVRINDFEAAFQATEFLIKNDNKRIGFIGGVTSKTVFNQRFLGYKKAIKKNRLCLDESLNFNCKSIYQEHEYNELVHFLEKLKVMPDAFFCATDNYAILCIKALTRLKYNVPKDIEVIGFGNLFYSTMFVPELTTVAQPSFKMGKMAAEMLINKIKNNFYLQDNTNELILETKLVQRNTTR